MALKDYRKALLAAEQAERLAKVIEERYRATRKVLGELKTVIRELEDLDLDAADARSALQTARQRIKQGTMEDGCLIPNYLEARISAEAAIKTANSKIHKAKEASDLIFTAQLAVDALKEMQTPLDPQIMESVILTPLDGLLHKSTVLLADGNLEEALSLAKDAEERANSIRIDMAECMTSLASCENTLKALNAEGISVQRASQLLNGGRNLFAFGKISEAKETILRAEKEAVTVSSQYQKAATAIKAAEDSMRDLHKVGASSEDSQKRISDAKKALANGKYLRAFDLAEDCRRSVGRRLEIHNELGQSLRDLKASVEHLKKSGLVFSNEVDEIIARAERSYQSGDYVNCGKDMKIASVLLGTTDTGKKNPIYLLNNEKK